MSDNIQTCPACGEEYSPAFDSVGLCPDCESEPVESDDDAICSVCNGSGEGQHDGTRCWYCKGSGVAK